MAPPHPQAIRVLLRCIIVFAATCAAGASLAIAQPPSGQDAPQGGFTLDAESQARIINAIIVEGNQRIETDTIASYLVVGAGDPLDPRLIDLSLKALFRTGLFSDVRIIQQGADLVIRVRENPIVNQVLFEGNQRIKEDKLTEELQLAPRSVYTRAKVQADVQRILEVYRRSGRFGATVEPNVKPLSQNRVDLIYEIDEGPKTGVARINFIGNRIYSDDRLRNVIVTEESKRWKIWQTNANFDPDRLEFDQELLRQFYMRNGYADFRVESAVAELTPDRKDFFITFKIEEGVQYDFGEVVVKTDIDKLDPDQLEAALGIQEGEQFNGDRIEDSVDTLTFAAGVLGFAFVDVTPLIERDRQNRRVNLTFEIEEGPRVYVERININGNVRTIDKVIRREMRIVEGDAFNRVLLDRSRVRIRSLGFFSEVEIENTQGSAPDRTVVDVTVEEQATGAFSVGAGFSSTDNFIADISIEERNLLGRGQFLRFRVSASSRTQNLDIRFTEPYFLDRNLALGFEVFSSRTDFRESNFLSTNVGFGLLFGFPVNEYGRMNIRYQFSRENTEVDGFNCDIRRGSLFLRNICEDEGVRITSLIGYSMSFDRRDDPIDPTRGWSMQLSQELAGAGGDVNFLRTQFDASYFVPLYAGFVGMLRGNVGYIQGWNGDDVRLSDRFFRGGLSFRGFDIAGVGPRELNLDPRVDFDPDAEGVQRLFFNDALGGKLSAIGTAEVFVPLPLPESVRMKMSFFSDFGTVAYTDLTAAERLPHVIDERNGRTISGTFDGPDLRVTAGITLRWDSPFGPVQFDLSDAVVKRDFDRAEGFRFSAGTRF
ncbi:MAG: outer membrane protein assembly factor BamA [Parvularculaceae bacterium]